MLNTNQSDVRQVTGGGKDPLQIPDRFVGSGEAIRQEAATIALGKNSGKAPFGLWPGEGPHLENIHHEDIARFRPDDANGPTEDVRDGEVNITHIVRIVVVLNLAVRPVFAFHAEAGSWTDGGDGRNIGMPA